MLSEGCVPETPPSAITVGGAGFPRAEAGSTGGHVLCVTSPPRTLQAPQPPVTIVEPRLPRGAVSHPPGALLAPRGLVWRHRRALEAEATRVNGYMLEKKIKTMIPEISNNFSPHQEPYAPNHWFSKFRRLGVGAFRHFLVSSCSLVKMIH